MISIQHLLLPGASNKTKMGQTVPAESGELNTSERGKTLANLQPMTYNSTRREPFSACNTRTICNGLTLMDPASR